MGSRPSFQFYPADEEKSTEIRTISLSAYGLWKRMQNIMHFGEPYGHLTMPTGAAVDPAQLARMVGESTTIVRRLLKELEGAGVFSRTEGGVIYSRRMVRDEHLRTVRAAAGAKGGASSVASRLPDGLPKQKGKQPGKQTGKQNTPPSSSSSSSSSSSQKKDPPNLPDEQGGKRRRVAVALPDDWAPTAEHTALAEELGLDLAAQLERFRDWVADRGTTSKDWEARFRNWLRKAREIAGPQVGVTNGAHAHAPEVDPAAPWIAGFEALSR